MSDTEEAAPSTEAAVATPVYLIQRETTVRRFHGDDAHYTAEEFETEIKRAWEANHLTKAQEKYNFLLHNLGPSVKTELRCQGVGNDPKEVLATIVDIYGERRSPAVLSQELYRLQQFPGESIRGYLHRLHVAFDVLKRRCTQLRQAVPEEAVLTEHFIQSLQDPVLTKILRERQCEEAKSFKEIREGAIRWADDERGSTAQASVVQVASKSPQQDRIDKLEGLVASLMTKMESFLEKKQEEHVHKVQNDRECHRNGQNWKQRGRSGDGPSNRPSRDKDGKFLCFRCGKPGHMRRQCPEN